MTTKKPKTVRLDAFIENPDNPQDERFATWEPSWSRPRLKRPDLLMIDYK